MSLCFCSPFSAPHLFWLCSLSPSLYLWSHLSVFPKLFCLYIILCLYLKPFSSRLTQLVYIHGSIFLFPDFWPPTGWTLTYWQKTCLQVTLKIKNLFKSQPTFIRPSVLYPTQICDSPCMDTHIYVDTQTYTHSQLTTIHMYTSACTYTHTYMYSHRAIIVSQVCSYLSLLISISLSINEGGLISL